MLGERSRVAFFNKIKIFKQKLCKIGWPLNLVEEGSCWTTNNSKEDFDRIMNFLIYNDDTEFKKFCNN